MNRRNSLLGELSDEEQPEGAVIAFLDESFDPTVAACAVIIESSDALNMNSKIEATFEQVQGWYHLGGMPSFEEFRRRGFHATSDAYEVRVAFTAFLAETLSFKSMIVYSDRTLRSGLSDKKRLVIVYDQLLRDILRAYRSRPMVSLYFESAQGMDLYLERVAHRAARSGGRNGPELKVLFGTKRKPHMLAAPDYVLHIFNQWQAMQINGEAVFDPAQHQSRSLKAILGSISMARSLDGDAVVRRTHGARNAV